MIRFLTAAGCASALALAASAALADPPVESSAVMPATVKAPPSTAATPSKDKDNEMVCFKEEQTGTRLGARRVCMTRAQAAQRAQDAKDVLNDTRGRLATSPQ